MLAQVDSTWVQVGQAGPQNPQCWPQVGSTWVQVGQVGSLLEAPGPQKTQENFWFFIIFQNPILGIVWTQVGSMLAQLGPS